MENRPRMAWGGDGRNWRSKERALDSMAKKPITKKVQGEAVSWLADLDANLKAFRNQVKTMETVWLTGQKAFTPKQVKNQQKLFDQAHQHVVAAQHIYQQAEAQLRLAKQYNDVVQHANVH